MIDDVPVVVTDDLADTDLMDFYEHVAVDGVDFRIEVIVAAFHRGAELEADSSSVGNLDSQHHDDCYENYYNGHVGNTDCPNDNYYAHCYSGCDCVDYESKLDNSYIC